MDLPEFPPKVGVGDFGEALWNPEAATPSGLIGPDGLTAPKRFNVYRNNVIVSLCDALEQTFPALQNLLGEDYFKALARAFVVQHPPKSPVLIWYGSDFPDFIEAFPPLASYPYLADVARVEWAWVQAYHAADVAPLDPAALGSVDPNVLGSIRFEKHPAAALIMSSWPVWDLARANRFEPDEEIRVDLDRSQSVLIARPEFDVELLQLRPGGDVFLNALLSGATLGEAAALAEGQVAEFSLSDCLSDCLSIGVFTDLVTA
ncbi:DUF2063 domain-containing protein [Roseibium album]|uniref:HvfC/BufC N-terminal domain-containing protein n=1 Tax=Roseibium album TaxID=311410 RepID=UPI0018C97366|nr:DNA-binding domain-containing protein [Roseibium album]MBG6164229.1 hypothetical protein [Labrenzia sp. EL_195]MBG6175863.1 hypothetical protein [Labrenzia sp. EL_132]